MRALLAAAAALLLFCAPAQAAEVINQYDSLIKVQADGTLEITETIEVTAEGVEIKRGIFRDLPRGRRMPLGGIVPTNYEIQSVTRDGHEEPYMLEQSSTALRVYIGDAEIFLTPGRYTYELTYTIPDQISFFDDIDELNWNAIGTEWAFPIQRAHVTILLPNQAPIKNYHVYTGPLLSVAGAYDVQTKKDGELSFTANALAPGEGVTVALSWPKGYVEDDGSRTGLAFFLRQHPGLPLMLGALLATILFYRYAWRLYGKDPGTRRLAPFYTPPKDISPAMAACIQKMGVVNQNRALSAAVISLAAKGFLEIEEKDKGTFTLTARHGHQKPGAVASADEEIIMAGIDRTMTLTPSNPVWIATARKHAEKIGKLCDKDYFADNVMWWMAGWLPVCAGMVVMAVQGQVFPAVFLTVAVAMLFCDWARARLIDYKRTMVGLRHALCIAILLPVLTLTVILTGGSISWLTALATAVCVLIIIMMRHAMKRPTPKGLEIMEQIDGLQHYMEVVEEKILKTFDPPQMSRQLYEDYLPYAVALNVESKWGAKFAASVAGAALAAAAATQPSWYTSSHGGSPGNFSVDRMVGGFTQALSAAATSPSSGSSSSGGGSVGSGGGGGGGGGW